MKFTASIKPICVDCRVVRRNGRVSLVHRGDTNCNRKAARFGGQESEEL